MHVNADSDLSGDRLQFVMPGLGKNESQQKSNFLRA